MAELFIKTLTNICTFVDMVKINLIVQMEVVLETWIQVIIHVIEFKESTVEKGWLLHRSILRLYKETRNANNKPNN